MFYTQCFVSINGNICWESSLSILSMFLIPVTASFPRVFAPRKIWHRIILHNRCVRSVTFPLCTTFFVKNKNKALTFCPLFASFCTYAPDNAKCYNGLALMHSIEGTFFFLKECYYCWSKGWSDMQTEEWLNIFRYQR